MMGYCCHCGALTGCRNIWTPNSGQLFKSVLNAWSGDMTMDRPQFGTILGNGVPVGDPWAVGAVSGQLAFTSQIETEDVMVEGSIFDAFSLGSMPEMPWEFIDDPDTACGESVATSFPGGIHNVSRLASVPTPGNLSDADLVALGVSDSYPSFGIPATILGPVISFDYTETFSAQAVFSFLNGQHRLQLSCVIDVSRRNNIRRVRAITSGTKPNRVTVFSTTTSGFVTGDDDYQLNFNWTWESPVRLPVHYNSVTSRSESLVENLLVSPHGWNPAGGRFDHGTSNRIAPSDPSDGLVALPSFTDISWGL